MPELTIPADYTSECSDDLMLDDASATDNCGEVTIEVSARRLLATRWQLHGCSHVHGDGRRWQQHVCRADDYVEDTTAPELTIPAVTLLSVLTT